MSKGSFQTIIKFNFNNEIKGSSSVSNKNEKLTGKLKRSIGFNSSFNEDNCSEYSMNSIFKNTHKKIVALKKTNSTLFRVIKKNNNSTLNSNHNSSSLKYHSNSFCSLNNKEFIVSKILNKIKIEDEKKELYDENRLNIFDYRTKFLKQYNKEMIKYDQINKKVDIFKDNNKNEEYKNLQVSKKKYINFFGKFFYDIELISGEKIFDIFSLKKILKYQNEIISTSNKINELLVNEIKILNNKEKKNCISNFLNSKIETKINNNLKMKKNNQINVNNLNEENIKRKERENKLKLKIYYLEHEIEDLTKLLNKNKMFYEEYNKLKEIIQNKNEEIKNIIYNNKEKLNQKTAQLELYEEKMINLTNKKENMNQDSVFQNQLIEENKNLLSTICRLNEIIHMKDEELSIYIEKYYKQKNELKLYIK